jgi:hypothetical protein
VRRVIGILAGVVLACGCGGGAASGAAGADARFLLLAHQPLSGQLHTMADTRLLELGHQACAAMDANASPADIVAELGGSPEPGSADFNTYSFLVVDAATELCPTHKSQFSTIPS